MVAASDARGRVHSRGWGALQEMLPSFVRVNQRISGWLTPEFFRENSVFGMYAKVCGILLMQPGVQRVVDAGAGAAWPFPVDYKRRFSLYLIGVDIDEGEMQRNLALDERLVCDVCKRLPIADDAADVVTVYSGIEHFSDNAAFLRECARILRPGGRLVAQFPGRNAIFAFFNRAVPTSLANAILKVIRPDAADHLGFPAHYDRTNYRAFVALAKDAGFEVEYYHPGYFHSYFAFFVPLHIFGLIYGTMCLLTNMKNLASYNLFVIKKPGPSEEVVWGPYRVISERRKKSSSSEE